MKTRTSLIKKSTLASVSVLLSTFIYAQSPDITFIQDSKEVKVSSTEFEYDLIEIDRSSFEINFKGEELHAVAGLTFNIFEHTQAGTDINSDYNSYFYIFKYIAMSEDARFLPAGEDEAASLNPTHGAKPAGKKRSSYVVEALRVDGEDKPLTEFNEFFLALWLDSNMDQVVDEEELLKVKLILN